MKKRLRFIFCMAVLTAAGIVFCQLYWVYYNYQTAKANFIQTAQIALSQSIDSCRLSQTTLPTSLVYEKPTLTFFMRTIPDEDALALDTPHSTRRFSAQFETVAIDSAHLPEIKALIADLMSQQRNRSLNLDTLGLFFQRALRRHHVEECFSLSIERGNLVTPGQIAVVVNAYKAPLVVKAELVSKEEFLYKHNFSPALVSSLFIFLSAFSLLYMWTIINAQMKLDSMKTDFVNNIVHELRTPLAVLKSSNEAMSNFGAAEDPVAFRRLLKINAVVVDDLDANIERILEFTRLEQNTSPPIYEKVSLQEVVDQVKQRFSFVDDASIEYKADEDPFIVVVDVYMLRVILMNLIDNAIKYSRDKAIIEIAAVRSECKWQFTVRDHGIGIASARLPYIFDRFYRVPTGDVHDIKGYGIGLSYVKQLVMAMKGKITVSSEVGKGTSFTVTFYS